MARVEADLVLHHANELLTLSGHSHEPSTRPETSDLGIIRDGALAVHGTGIVWVGETNRLRQNVTLKRDAVRIDCHKKTVLPGFVDPHTHLIFAASREDELEMKVQGKV